MERSNLNLKGVLLSHAGSSEWEIIGMLTNLCLFSCVHFIYEIIRAHSHIVLLSVEIPFYSYKSDKDGSILRYRAVYSRGSWRTFQRTVRNSETSRMKMKVFCDIAPCSLLEADRRFRVSFSPPCEPEHSKRRDVIQVRCDKI